MISAHGLRLAFGERLALDGVSFEVARGQAVALVGPNGSGKSSVFRCLLGLVPFRGSVTIDGVDAVAEPVRARARLAYLPQRAAFGDAPAREVLTFVARIRRIDRGRVGEVLREVGLEAHAAEKARTFSGGMQQRLSLAIALLCDAPVLLLDEPTASLDQEGQDVFASNVKRLRDEGRTLLLASHRPEEVVRLTDRIVRLDNGRIVESAPSSESRAQVVALHRDRAVGGAA